MARWENESLYDGEQSLQFSMKPLLTTVDHSQLKTTSNIDAGYWLTGESIHQGDFIERQRRPSSAPHVVFHPAINPVVPSVVEEKAAEDDFEAQQSGRPTTNRSRCRDVDAAVRTTPAARPPIHHMPYAISDQHASSAAAALPSFQALDLLIPSSVCRTLKDEPQTVPCGVRQDSTRAERKRELNRLAAQKCRQRKLDQVAMLQERVDALNRDKVNLQQTADLLRRKVDALRCHLNQHLHNGCRISHADLQL